MFGCLQRYGSWFPKIRSQTSVFCLCLSDLIMPKLFTQTSDLFRRLNWSCVNSHTGEKCIPYMNLMWITTSTISSRETVSSAYVNLEQNKLNSNNVILGFLYLPYLLWKTKKIKVRTNIFLLFASILLEPKGDLFAYIFCTQRYFFGWFDFITSKWLNQQVYFTLPIDWRICCDEVSVLS